MIVVIDNYDSFTYNLVHLVARSTSDLKVFRNDALGVADVAAMNPSGILLSPGPGRPADAGISEDIVRELGPEIPILGVCLGHQAIGEVFGGRIVHAASLMHGKTSTIRHDGSGVFEDLPQDFVATRYHSLVVQDESYSDELRVTARTDDGTIMGIVHREWPLVGIQFHPESVLTVEGPRLIANWMRLVSSYQPSISP